MFSKRVKNREEETQPELRRLLIEAVARNASIGIVRLGRACEDPLAQGRLLAWNDEGLIVEDLQVIGRDIRFGPGARVEAFVKFRDTTLMFECEVIDASVRSRLNDERSVLSVRLSQPRLLRKGDRRSAFRSLVTANGSEIPVRIWFIDRLLEEGEPVVHPRRQKQKYYTDLLAARRRRAIVPPPGEEASGRGGDGIDWASVISEAKGDPAHAVGRLVDLTPNGIGVLMYGVAKMQLVRFERMVVEFELEGEAIDLVVEVRHGVDLPGSTCRVGCLIVCPHISHTHAPERRLLERAAIRVQREQLRKRRSA